MQTKHGWRNALTGIDLAWLHFKFALLVMLAGAASLNLTLKATLASQMLFVWVGIMALGFLASVIGIIRGARHQGKRLSDLQLEMVGLWLMMGGPLVFLSVQAGVWITTGEQKLVAILFPYVIAAAIVARMLMVWSAMKAANYRFPGESEEDE